MRVEFLRQFQKDLSKLKNKSTVQRVIDTIEKVKEANSLADIPNIKKLKGFENTYRIRVNDYRIGLFINDDVATFARFLHRKDIYTYFP